MKVTFLDIKAININIKQNTDVDIKKTLAGTFVLNNFGYLL